MFLGKHSENDEAAQNVGALILAAGVSERMKTPKALLVYHDMTTFIEKIAVTYLDWGCKKVVVVVNKMIEGDVRRIIKPFSNISLIVNDCLDYGRFYSLKTGLAEFSNTDWCFVQNVDNPFITGEILTMIYHKRHPDENVVPVYKEKGGHPFLLPSSLIKEVRNVIENPVNLKDVLRSMPTRKVEIADENILININTTDIYASYCKTNIW